MNVVFAGTGSFAMAALEALIDRPAPELDLRGVVTLPDRTKGRGRKVVPSEIAARAEAASIPVWRTTDVNAEDSMSWIAEHRPDVVAVVDFGQLVKKALLELPKHGCVNLHPSLLPRHRGASPVPYTILSGDEHTAVTIIRMVRRMDAGPMLSQVATPVDPSETAGELAERLRPLGALLLQTTLRALASGEVEGDPQDDARATLAPKLTPDDRRVDWSLSAAEVARRIRAMSPKPGVTVFLERGDGPPLRVQLLRATVDEATESASGSDADAFGRIERVDAEAVVVRTGAGCVAVRSFKPAGKGELSAADFERGYRPEVGRRFFSEEPDA